MKQEINKFFKTKEKVTENIIKKNAPKAVVKRHLLIFAGVLTLFGGMTTMATNIDSDKTKLFACKTAHEEHNLLLIMLSLYTIACSVIISVILSNIKDGMFLFNKKINQTDIHKAIDLIARIKKDYPEIPNKIDIDNIKRLADVLPIVIKNMSNEDKVALNALCTSDKKVLHDKDWYAKISKVFEIYFIDKPQDLKLITDAYNGIMTFNAQMFEKKQRVI